uniref:Retrotrans_gag domain-containing protein n=1 Tax=Caenorhabditis japonica TaxID=281687 RepID=A0A8R1E466_CAEJA
MEDRIAWLELDRKRATIWPQFNPQQESWRSFIKTVNEFCNCTARTEADAFRALPIMLPSEWKEAYRQVVQPNDTWRTAIDKLRDAVLTTERRAEYSATLSATSQGPMSIAEYAKKIAELSNNANPNEEAREQIALSAFLHGLNAPLRKEVRKKVPATFQEAVSFAKTLEAIDNMERNDIVTAVNELAATVNAMRLEDHRDYSRGDQSRERFRRYDNSRHRYSSRDYSRERHPRREHSRHQPPARDHSKDRSSKKDNFRRQSPESEPRRDRNHYRRDNSRQWRRDENRPNRGRSIHKAKTNFLFASVVMALVSLSACE